MTTNFRLIQLSFFKKLKERRVQFLFDILFLLIGFFFGSISPNLLSRFSSLSGLIGFVLLIFIESIGFLAVFLKKEKWILFFRRGFITAIVYDCFKVGS
uniref:Hypothetical chloroplast RF20 n=1 Tax=Pyramimonas parkeae TaxID=36894 RepID=A0A1R7T0W1_9CHLO|nr:hypothetical chloroplast RF20 [Pyramimonas parkeae]